MNWAVKLNLIAVVMNATIYALDPGPVQLACGALGVCGAIVSWRSK